MHILLTQFRGPQESLRFIDSLYQDARREVIHVDRELERAAVDQWLRRFADQPLSLADAVSFGVMRSRRIREALSLDVHFKVAGFGVLP